MRLAGHALGGTALAGCAIRLLSPPAGDAEFVAQARRYAWQIDPAKCRSCGVCESACIRNPSAVKALNDQQRCSNCVVCYGHISDTGIESEKIEREGRRVCPRDAVTRKCFCGGLDGMYLYAHDHANCTGCARCVKACHDHGTKSMFLAIRPDLCLGCNACSIAVACPHDAIERVPREAVDDLLDEFGGEEWLWSEEAG
jgi:electron transport complex protein RnfB